MDYIAEIFSAGCAILIFYWQRQQKKRDEIIEKRAEARKTESLLALEMSMATGQMCRVQIEALHGGKVNGNVDEAVRIYDDAVQKYRSFLQGQAMDNLNR